MPATKTLTIESLIAEYADGIAFAAEEQPATTVDGFAAQLRDSVRTFELAGINGTDELEDAATYLVDAASSTDLAEQAVLLKKAAKNLAYAHDMVSELRDMV
ncbi:hypothetical protein G3I39_24975 [Streptomyces fulvissimus]|uniref:Uncharacterized protein n=1 Tax=Streptomyces microflavus TaxID=1919 RepID=A0A6N9VFN5_STRMI|nr:hypothetical protein [Streptomyces microflavus]NEB70282.1 hypothetical protein [Streptomyces microflavus]NEE50983.1 hypothetical protein [Streptomyces sp. SID8455]NEE56335.1 hypothetical protein [Streptomyces sp. SID8455]